MNLNEVADSVFETLKESLGEAYVIRAYPFTDKPSDLKRPVIAVYPAELDCSAVSLGSAAQYGTAKVKTEIYVASKCGCAEASKTAEKAVSAVGTLFPCGISASAVKSDDRLNCLYITCIFSFDYFTENTEE